MSKEMLALEAFDVKDIIRGYFKAIYCLEDNIVPRDPWTGTKTNLDRFHDTKVFLTGHQNSNRVVDERHGPHHDSDIRHGVVQKQLA
jgi:hypothetical protein